MTLSDHKNQSKCTKERRRNEVGHEVGHKGGHEDGQEVGQEGAYVFVGKWFLKSLSEIRDDVLQGGHIQLIA